jgi:HK97 family phage prohead protease
MSRLQKTHSIVITSVQGKTVRALVAVFGNVDLQGDRVMPGAFTNSIAEWEASGDKLPFLWSHDWGDPFAHLGVVTSMWESPRGLEVEAEILDDNPFAKQVQKLLDQRRVVQFSFAYDTVRERMAEDGANELLELKLIECGPCLSGANPYTQLLSRKSVQQMLAAEQGGTWAGTTIPKAAVDELRSRVSGVVESFLDDIYETEAKHMTPQKTTDPTLDRLNAEIDALTTSSNPSRDADLLKRLDELTGDKVAAGGNVTPATASVLMNAANHLAQSAVRSQVAGLVDAEAALMSAAGDLRTMASGGEGDVAAIIASVQPLIAELRAVNPVAASGLERALVELAGGVNIEYVTNEDRIGGSLEVTEGVVSERDRYAPKSSAPLVDARFRPIGQPAAAVPVDSGETFRVPVVTTESYRTEDE